MQAAADAQSRVMVVDGVQFRQHALGTVEYHRLCGALRVRRFSYRPVGERNGRTCVPFDLQLGIVEGATAALAFCIRRAREQRPSIKVGVLQDGAPELWHRMLTALFDDFEFKGCRWGIGLWRRLPCHDFPERARAA
jgi:hypothetical protein